MAWIIFHELSSPSITKCLLTLFTLTYWWTHYSHAWWFCWLCLSSFPFLLILVQLLLRQHLLSLCFQIPLTQTQVINYTFQISRIKIYYTKSIWITFYKAKYCTDWMAQLAVCLYKNYNTLILSVSIGVLATKILAFSILFGWFTPIFLSNKKPVIKAVH